MATDTGLIKTKKEAASDLEVLIERYSGKLRDVLPKHLTPERMIRMARLMIHTNSRLRECSGLSIVAALVQAGYYGLEIGTEAHIVPFDGQAVMIPDYRGMLKRARNSGQVSNVIPDVVRKGDKFIISRGMNPNLIHEPLLTGKHDEAGQERPITHFYCCVWLKDAPYPQFEVMTEAEMREFRDRTPTAFRKKGPWWDEATYWRMGLKTIMKRTLNLCPLASEDLMLIQNDDKVDAGLLPSPQEILGMHTTGNVVIPYDPADGSAGAQEAEQAKDPLNTLADKVNEKAGVSADSSAKESPKNADNPPPQPKKEAAPKAAKAKKEPPAKVAPAAPEPAPTQPELPTEAKGSNGELQGDLRALRDLIYEFADGDEKMALEILAKCSQIRPGGELRYAQRFEDMIGKDWWIKRTAKNFAAAQKELGG